MLLPRMRWLSLFAVAVCCSGFGRGEDHRGSRGQEPDQGGGLQSYGLPQCEATRRHFVSAHIGASNIVPANPIRDAEMEICYKGAHDTQTESCCSRKMEKRYHSQAERDFYDVLRSTSSYLKGLLTSNSAQYKEQFLLMIRNAENNTDSLFTEVFKIKTTDRRGPLKTLFIDLQEYLQGRRVDIHETVANFFDQLFPLVFYNNLNDPQSVNLEEEYLTCLSESRQQLFPHPFGEVPNQLSHQISKSMSTARTFLEALSLATETVNTTDFLELEPQCSRALTRLRYCSHCQGFVEAQPCRNFCYNVMRGCLATTAEIDRHWNTFVDLIKGMTVHMKGYYNLEDTLNNLHTRIYEAILHSMETGHKYYAQVVDKCGQPSTNVNPVAKPANHMDGTASASRASTKVTVYGRFDNFLRSLMASKGFYHSLADTMCSAKTFATGIDQKHCWNGDSLGRYNKTLVDVDLASQMEYNPEMHVAEKKSSSIKSVIDKLMHQQKQLQSKISYEMMQADDWSSVYNKKTHRRIKSGDKRKNRRTEDDDRDWSGDNQGNVYYGHIDDEDESSGYYDHNSHHTTSNRHRGNNNREGSGDDRYNPYGDDEDFNGSGQDGDYNKWHRTEKEQKYKPGRPNRKSKSKGHSDPDIYLEDEKPTRPQSTNRNYDKQHDQSTGAAVHISFGPTLITTMILTLFIQLLW